MLGKYKSSNKFQILWFSNVAITKERVTLTGTWLHAMARELVKTGKVTLYNITVGNVKTVEFAQIDGVKQWILPKDKLNSKGLPKKETILAIQEIVKKVQPDIIHIWGTENYWSTLSAKGYIKGKVLLEIQGVCSEIAKYIYSGLRPFDLVRCTGIYEVLRPRMSLQQRRNRAVRIGNREIAAVRAHSRISVQSEWTKNKIKLMNPNIKIYKTKMALRKEFYEVDKWKQDNAKQRSILFVSSSLRPFKGFHVLVDALVLVARSYPDAVLHVAAPVSKGIRTSGYVRWIKKKLEKNQLDQKVLWHGSVDSKELIKLMQRTNVVVVPSYVESYCVTMDEALAVGCPVVAAYSCAMPELAKDECSALFFPAGDSEKCAKQISRIFEKPSLAKSLSESAYAERRDSKEKPVDIQMSIYCDIMNEDMNA